MLPCFILLSNIPCLRDFWVWGKYWYCADVASPPLSLSNPQTGNLNIHLLPPSPPPPTRLAGLVHRGLPNTPWGLFKHRGQRVCHSAFQVWSEGLLALVTQLCRNFWLACDWQTDQAPRRGLLPKIRGAALQAKVSRNPWAALEERQWWFQSLVDQPVG